MSEQETNPQHKPVWPGDEVTRPELSGAGPAPSDSAATPATPAPQAAAPPPPAPPTPPTPAAPAAPAPPAGPTPPIASAPPAGPTPPAAPGHPANPWQSPRPAGEQPRAAAPAYAPSPWQAPRPDATQSHAVPAGAPQSGVPHAPAHPGGPHAAPQSGVPHSGPPHQPHTAPPYPGQQPSQPPWAVNVGQPGYPHQPYPGGSPWAQQPGAGQSGGSRVGRAFAAGAVALVLMLGSGLAGGALALGLSDERAGGNRTYTAAPIINSADLPAIAASVQDSVVSVTTGSGGGSGVVLSADGFVLTNNHVVAGSDSVTLAFANGRRAQARIIGTDPKSDLAVLKAEGVGDLSPATFGDSDAMQVGNTVLALGSPLGLEGSVTAGIISAKDRTIRAGGDQQQQGAGATSISGLLQTDAPINPGNSGGALVNTNGEVIGINTAILTAGQSQGNIGVGFAIPSNKAKSVAEALQRGEKVSHPALGVSVGPADGGGALVAQVVPNGAAAQIGLQQGDVIKEFDGKPVNDSDDLINAVQARKVGDRVEITYERNGTEVKATVTLTEAS
ncbi:trypsin-like peptidase domain-containing protein [Polymorphospora sp. NPDC050346]|uniref:trypsin-like peptidase domain-containing protein n=1 Tax=Polymorphospora sp. NPDC050346 TaxID=3155780 RepID=UPI0033EF9A40